MSRRAIFTVSFIAFVAVVIWFTSAAVRLPELTFHESMQIGDHKKRVIVPTKVVKERLITPEGTAVTFYAVDRQGTEAKVHYEGSDVLTAGQLSKAAESGAEISVAGHYCGDQFKANQVYLPAY